MKKPSLFIICFLFLFSSIFSQAPVNRRVFGQNAWYINNANNPAANLAGFWKKIAESGVSYVRIGGIDANFIPLYKWTPGSFAVPSNSVIPLRNVIDSIRKYGMEPIIEVGYVPPNTCTNSALSGVSLQNASTIAANVVDVINNNIYASNPIKTWVIANEPDLYVQCSPVFKGFGWNNDGASHADSIAEYIRLFATKMKGKDTSIKIIGPEMATYGTDANYSVNKIMNKLVNAQTNGNSVMGKITTGAGSGKYFVDHLTVHHYPNIASRQQAIDNPQDIDDGFNGVLNANAFSNGKPRNGLIKMLTSTANNTGRNSNNIKIGLTEYNIGNSSGLHEANDSVLVRKGYDYRSFLGGQFIAQELSIGMANPYTGFMNLWSVKESGTDPSGCLDGFGYISNCNNSNKLRSAYHHFKMVGTHWYGNYYSGTSNKNNVKTFASVEPGAGFYIMILNMDSVDHAFNMKFNNTAGTSPDLNLKYDFTAAGLPLTTNQYDSIISKKTTWLLQFDCSGKLIMKTSYSESNNVSGQAPQLIQIGNINLNPNLAIGGQPGIGGIINSNLSFSNTVVYISSTLKLVGQAKLSLSNATVIVAPNVGIEANPNTSIEIKNGTVIFGQDSKQWSGITMNGNYNNSESLVIENSYIINAKYPVATDKIGRLTIKDNVIVNGETALYFDRSEAFSLSGNLIAGFIVGLKTTRTKKGFVSEIRENIFAEVRTNVTFSNDMHNALSITCNTFRYSDRAIKSVATDLAEQGTASLSSGNTFLRAVSGTPINYIDHSGSATKYYFGPAQANLFSYPNVMNIPKIQSVSDRVCKQPFTSACAPFVLVKENSNPINQLSIYPNPNTGAFTVNFGSLPKGNWSIVIHDVIGRLISTQKIDYSLQSTLVNIEAKGLYFVTLQNGTDKLTKKVVVE
ncbi:MAG: T9SS type A sorting domain-containing protein [Bacteroidetes bacterium]|nr:T9SS type A sorting domain-containing protein [Bacteroidota bacterium]